MLLALLSLALMVLMPACGHKEEGHHHHGHHHHGKTKKMDNNKEDMDKDVDVDGDEVYDDEDME